MVFVGSDGKQNCCFSHAKTQSLPLRKHTITMILPKAQSIPLPLYCPCNIQKIFLFRSAVFILVSSVCNLRIGIVHYGSTNVKRIFMLYTASLKIYIAIPSGRKVPITDATVEETTYARKKKIGHVTPHLILGSIDHYSVTVKVTHHQSLYRLD